MNQMRKSQTATEYLVILAVVIIIALIVVGVLGVIPGIGGTSSGQAKATYWKTATIAIDSAALAEGTKNDTIVLRNTLAQAIQVQGVWIGTTIDARDASDDIMGSSFYNVADTTLAPGQTMRLSGANVINCTAGETVNFYITVQYEELATSAVFNFSGRDNPYEVTCSVQ
ncbi:MAG: hypothetical protein ACOCWQ_01385 [Nanoarchaeota archaeon]